MTPLREVITAYASLSIIGMSKNAGKTTVLGALIGLLAGTDRVPALTSIGRDGEAVDVVTGTKKPEIWVRAGTLLATAADMLRFCDISREIVGSTGMQTPLGEVVILRALSDGYVQLAGPSMNAQLTTLKQRLRTLGADIVLIDGAASRKSLAAPALTQATILCAGASYSPDMQKVVDDTAYTCRLLQLPLASGQAENHVFLQGAATEHVVSQLRLAKGAEVTVRDASCMLLSRQVYARYLARGIRFSVIQTSRLCCVCINPYAARGMPFDAAEFYEKMARAVDVPVVNVRGMQG